MTTRLAACSCGELQLTCEGEPVRVSMCHCFACQRRTGSAFGVQARFQRSQVTLIKGRATAFVRIADSGNPLTFYFCPVCGATVYYELSSFPDVIGVPVGAFADPNFPAPRHFVYESRRHHWVQWPTDRNGAHVD
jgi:hypothetical protein